MVAIANAVLAPVSSRPMPPSLGSARSGARARDPQHEHAEIGDGDDAGGGDAA